MNRAVQDLRLAFRSLRRAPGFALTALLTLAVSIGLTAAMYGVARQALLAPLPYTHPDRLVALQIGFAGDTPSTRQVGMATDFLRHNTRSFESVGVSDGGPTAINVSSTLSGQARAFPAQQLHVSRDFLPTLGIHPVLGRGFTPEEDLPTGPRAAVLSDVMWRTHFNADPAIVGRLIRIDEEDVPVVGVLPKGVLADMQGGTRETDPAGIFQPLKLSPKDPGYQGTNYSMIARLRDGVAQAQAQQELDTLLPEFARQYTSYAHWTASDGAHPRLLAPALHDALVGNVRRSLLLLLCAAAAVMMIACLNLSGLMVARTVARTRELAVRSALGAGRAELLRLLLAEAALLAVTGAMLGLLSASALAKAFVTYAPVSVPRLQPLTALAPLAGAAATLAAIAMLFFGLMPALVALRRDTIKGLRDSGSQGHSARYGRTSRGLIVAQVALTFVMLTAASLLLHVFLSMRSIAPGVATDQVTIGQVSLKGDAFGKTSRYTTFTTRVLEALMRTPGVSAAGAVNGLPLDRGLNDSGWPTGRRDEENGIETRFASPDYLRAIGIPVLRGRDIRAADTKTAPRIAVVNEAMAKLWWPKGDSIGHRVNLGDPGDYEIVGVARDTKEGSLLEQAKPLAYVALAQSTDGQTRMINNWFATTFVVRAERGVNVADSIAKAVLAADPDLPLTRVETMQDVVDQSMQEPRFFSSMTSSVSLFTLLLAAIGLFGLLSYQVTQRTREIGVRMALGATRSHVLAGFVLRGLSLATLGLLLGTVLSLGLPKLLSSTFWEFAAVHGAPHAGAGELLASSGAALLLLAVTAVASLIPARRASSVEPVVALRTE